MNKYDYIIVGSGIAGLYSALLAQKQGSVLIITKGSIEDCNTRHAQGGIAAAIGNTDSPELHFQDTIAAGAGLCNEEAVRILAQEAPDRIADLVQFGVPFDTVNGEIALTMEAAHSKPRILHAGGDATGAYIETTLSNRVRAARIRVLEYFLVNEIVVEGGQVESVKVLDCLTGHSEEFACRYLILATGGAGQLFKTTTNPEVATGNGVALAFRAGAEIADMEFYQFHPTALHMQGVSAFLISEAVRGEGGVLRDIHGRRFMPDYNPAADLAPRDVVARSIVYEMKKTGAENVFLDVTHLPQSLITTRFPHIYRFCLEHGLDITKQQIPVAPAAHYIIGGVKTNLWGETNIRGLFATGEVACTGVHGANRLASNSMLEVLVFSKRIMDRTGPNPPSGTSREDKIDSVLYQLNERTGDKNALPPTRAALQELMWDKVGILRSQKGLTEAADTLAAWQKMLPAPTDRPSHELSNLITTGQLVTEAALIRKESRGAHFRLDFPQPSDDWLRHIVFKES